MNFSKHKLQRYLKEDATAETNSEMASEKSSNAAAARNDRRAAKMASKQQNFSQPQGTAMKNKMQYSSFDAEALRREKEAIKMMEDQKSDWRQDLQEKVVDGQEREDHPYVTVMPTGDENLIQAIKQMGKEVKGKKDAMKEESDHMKNAPSIKNVKVEKKTNVKKYPGLGFAPTIKKEEVEELEEKKKECKKGYKRDEDGNCVKKKSSKTTVIVGRGWGYGGGHHHHDDDDDDNGSDGGSDGGDGGMGEMFDILGDMLLQEMNFRDAQKKGLMVKTPDKPFDWKKKNEENAARAIKNMKPTSMKDRAKD